MPTIAVVPLDNAGKGRSYKANREALEAVRDRKPMIANITETWPAHVKEAIGDVFGNDYGIHTRGGQSVTKVWDKKRVRRLRPSWEIMLNENFYYNSRLLWDDRWAMCDMFEVIATSEKFIDLGVHGAPNLPNKGARVVQEGIKDRERAREAIARLYENRVRPVATTGDFNTKHLNPNLTRLVVDKEPIIHGEFHIGEGMRWDRLSGKSFFIPKTDHSGLWINANLKPRKR